ncbi:MAG: DMT family transporter [Gammaproteobacteria bacterium]
MSEYRKGFWLTLAGVMAFTPDALLIRLTAIDTFTLAFGRGLLAGLVLLCFYMFFTKTGFLGALRPLGRWGVFFVFVQAASSIVFYAAFAFTSAANVLIIFACTPLASAVFSRILFGERIGRVTQLAIGGVAIGLFVVASGSLESGRWVGDVLAFIDTIILGLLFAIIRGRKETNMMPATTLGLLLAAGVSVFFADFPPMDALQWTWLLIGGLIILPVAIAFLTIGPRYLPSAEAAMLTLLESVLGPLWVWLAIGENPGMRSITGGAIVIGVLFTHSFVRFRQSV